MNDSMGDYVANETIKLMLKKGIQVLKSNILILGLSFKENCTDIRNTKVRDIYNSLKEYNVNLTVYDPWVDSKIAHEEYGIPVIDKLPEEKYDAAIMAVAHNEFLDFNILGCLKEKHVIFDVKGILNREIIDGRL